MAILQRAQVNGRAAWFHPESRPAATRQLCEDPGRLDHVWNTRGVERGYEYRLGVKLDDGTALRRVAVK